MKRFTLNSMTLVLALFVGSSAFSGPKAEPFKLIHAQDLATMMKDKDSVHIYDANNDETRSADGFIPGAVLLKSHDKYKVAQTLPPQKDSKLVFYCANEKCMASHAAAARAVKAGYKDVAVMSDEIQGWAKAGFEVKKPETKTEKKKS